MAPTKRAARGGAGAATATAAAGAAAADGPGAAAGPYTDWRLRGLLVAVLAAPWLAALAGLGAEGFAGEVREAARRAHVGAAVRDAGYAARPEFWALIGALSLPHLTYYWVWTRAEAFYRLTRPYMEPFHAFATVGLVLKLVQFSAALVYFCGPALLLSPAAWWGALRALLAAQAPLQLLLGLELFALGQLLNVAVYRTIGEAGVYYGCRLKQDVPWVYGFPFSTVPHPQYVGSTLSMWGGVVIAAASATAVAQGIYAAGVALTLFWAFSSWHESAL
jgi:hypothetical protein